ncbi:hypothetical protein Ctob_015439, partial [Chrysochromulina tobinii]
EGPSRRPTAPPYQLIPGDRYNFALGVLVAFGLAGLKNLSEDKLKKLGAPPFLKWNLNAYTTWNCALLTLRIILKQQQWDPFLLVNSMGIFLSFRTAFAQGLDENMRKKIRSLGFELSRLEFVLLDHLLHTLPPMLLLAALVQRGTRVHPMNALHVLALTSWFSFRQVASLDVQAVYMPHPFYRGLLAYLVGVFATPPLVDALIVRSRRRVLQWLIVMLIPYLTTKLDPNLLREYNFEAGLARARQQLLSAAAARTAKRIGSGRGSGANGMPRVQSDTPLVLESARRSAEERRNIMG